MSEALESAGVDVLVDFTSVVAVKDNVWTAVQAGVHVVIGSSGLTSEDYEGRPSGTPWTSDSSLSS